jgi:molybdopterin-binding protein
VPIEGLALKSPQVRGDRAAVHDRSRWTQWSDGGANSPAPSPTFSTRWIMASVKVTLKRGETITAAITHEAAEELKLAQRTTVTVLVTATEVMLTID